MRTAPLPLILAAIVTVSIGCSRAPENKPAPAAAASSTPSSGTLLLGERITSTVVPLADIARDPARYAGKTVATTGKVTAVCQEMGCWMEIRDEAGQAHIRMHGHNFFVPKTASGHVARVQATLVKGSDEECAEKGPSGGTLAKVELDATGVELD
jgi:hypothetical protein